MFAASSRRRRSRPATRGSRRNIPIDAVVDLSLDNPVAELGAGDIFGEMTCMSLYPRSATVRAKTDCVMLEMLRNVLDVIQRNKTLRAELEKNYRKRALEDHLRTVPLFSSLSPEFIDELAQQGGTGPLFQRRSALPAGRHRPELFPGAHRLREDGGRRIPGGDLVLAYQGKGGYFGEIGLILRGTYALHGHRAR